MYWKLLVFTFFILLTLSACSNVIPNESNTTPETVKAEDKYEKLVKAKNEEIVLETLELTSYGDKIGVTLKNPIYKKFSANGQVLIEGEIEKATDLKSNYVWIKVLSSEDGPAGKELEYYVPINDGKFKETIHFFNGEGTYNVMLQIPSTDQENYYYDTATFEVLNINPDYRRDVTYTPFGQEAKLSLDVKTSLVQEDGIFQLKGKVENLSENQNIMLTLTKDSETWKNIISVNNGQFEFDVPLFYGKGLHLLEVMVPDKEKDNYYQQATSILIDNVSSIAMKPIEYFEMYKERGITLEEPIFGGADADATFNLKGSIDPSAELASQTTHLYITTKKGEDEALEVIPVDDFKFDNSFFLRFGPGTYEVTLSVPEIIVEKSDYFRYFGVVTFEIESKASNDERNILPSRGVQSDAPQIIELANSLIKDKKSERDKSKAIYDYVAQNIAYDVDKFQNDDFNWDDSALKTLDLKTGVCQDYAYLTIALLRAIGLEARFIEGFASGAHAWVEVNVDGQWLTMDPTWGAGYIQNNQFVAVFNETFFDPDMTEFNKTHARTGVAY